MARVAEERAGAGDATDIWGGVGGDQNLAASKLNVVWKLLTAENVSCLTNWVVLK